MYFWVTVYTKSSAGCTIIDGSAGPAILKGPVLQHYMHAGVGQVKVAMWPDYPGCCSVTVCPVRMAWSPANALNSILSPVASDTVKNRKDMHNG